MTELLQQLVNGLTLGSLYALIAVGYTVVYGIIQLINFARELAFHSSNRSKVGAVNKDALISILDAS